MSRSAYNTMRLVTEKSAIKTFLGNGKTVVLACVFAIIAVGAGVGVLRNENINGFVLEWFLDSGNFNLIALIAAALVGLLVLPYLANFLAFLRNFHKESDQRKKDLAMRQLAIIHEKVSVHIARKGEPPASLATIGFSQTLLVNPWGNPFFYEKDGPHYKITTDMPSWVEGASDQVLPLGRQVRSASVRLA